jgi:hypothetical protein
MRARFKNRFARPCVKVVTELGHGLPHLICYAEVNETSLSVTMGPERYSVSDAGSGERSDGRTSGGDLVAQTNLAGSVATAYRCGQWSVEDICRKEICLAYRMQAVAMSFLDQ